MSRHSSQQTSPVQSSELHAPLSPQSSVTSSGSDSPHETDIYSRNTFLEEASGMRGGYFSKGLTLIGVLETSVPTILENPKILKIKFQHWILTNLSKL